jgi:hypothetical protein
MPAFGAAGTLAAAASGTSITPALPTGITAGQLLLAVVASKNNATHSWPAGWSKVMQVNSGASFTASVGARTATGTDAAPAVTWTGSVANTGQTWRYTGVDTVSPFGGSNVGTGTTTPHASTGFQTQRFGSLCIYVDVSSANTALTVPSGYANEFNGGSATSVTHIDVGDKTVAGLGVATGNISTAGANAAYVEWQFEINGYPPFGFFADPPRGRQMGLGVGSQQYSAWHSMPPPQVGIPVTAFNRSPYIVRRQKIYGGQFNVPLRAPPPIGFIYNATAFNRSPYIIRKQRIYGGQFSSPAQVFAVPQPYGGVQPDSPVVFRKPFRTALERTGIDDTLSAILLQGPVFSEGAWTFRKPFRVALERTGIDETLAPILLQGPVFSDNAIRIVKPKASIPFADIAFLLQVPAPATMGAYIEQPIVLKKPTPSLLPWADFVAPTVTPPPAAWGQFSESPYRIQLARPLLPWADYPFLPISLVPLVFSESPTGTKLPQALKQFADIAFLQIAYTPSAFWFSESPYQLKAPRPFEQQPFEVFPPAVVTPSSWGMFSESPWWFRKPFQLLQWADISFLQISYTPAAWGMFSESPGQLKKPFQLLQWADISFLQIAYTPSAWGMFSESPYQLKKPTPELMPWVGLPTLPVSLIPLVFTESPTRLTPPFLLRQFSDIAFLQVSYTPSAFGFSESQWTFRRPFLLNQFSDISFLQIAFTPSAFGFSEHPLANRNIRGWQQRLDQPGIAPIVPPPATQTPSALVFSEPQRHITMRWIGAAQLDLGNWGWATPPAVIVKNVWEWHIRYRRRGRR